MVVLPSLQSARAEAAAGKTPAEAQPRLAFGVQEVADALGVSRELVKQLGRRLISRKALDRFLAGTDHA